MSFHVGQKVVCVDASPNPKFPDVAANAAVHLREGGIYIIRGFDRFLRLGRRCVYIEGIFLRPRRGGRGAGDELAWKPERFRPITEHKTDISIFTALLDPNRLKELEPL